MLPIPRSCLRDIFPRLGLSHHLSCVIFTGRSQADSWYTSSAEHPDPDGRKNCSSPNEGGVQLELIDCGLDELNMSLSNHRECTDRRPRGSLSREVHRHPHYQWDPRLGTVPERISWSKYTLATMNPSRNRGLVLCRWRRRTIVQRRDLQCTVYRRRKSIRRPGYS